MPVHKIDRKALVTAAEALFNVPNTPLLKIKKSQLNHLINVCGDAVCVAEIENYLRYQAGREGTGWSVEAVRTVIAGPLAAANAARALALVESEPEEVAEMRAVQAWRLYAVYLTRAFTYRMAADKANAQGGGGARDAGHRGTPGPSHRGGEA